MTAQGGAAAVMLAAALLAGCGASSPASKPPQPPGGHTITLTLHHDTGDHQLLACSLVHHYARFPAGRPIAFDGTLLPARGTTRTKVKVKIKRCVDGRFQDSGAWDVRAAADGKFQGELHLPGNGVFFARARARTGQGVALSDKIYFDVR